MREDIRTIEEMAKIISSMSKGGSFRLQRQFMSMLGLPRFLKAVFHPDVGVDDNDNAEISSALTQLYDTARKTSAVRAIARALSDYGCRGYPRSSAVFLVSIVNLAITTLNDKATGLGQDRDHDRVDDDDYDRKMRKLEDYQEDIQCILECAKDIIKEKARNISRQTGLPKKLCQCALYTVPEPKYLDKYKLGFYLSTLLSNIYGYVDAGVNYTIDDYDDIAWAKLFSEVFGSSNVPDIASLILVEDPSRIDEYTMNPAEVQDCWNSLTDFALTSLNRQPTAVRNQMIELYLKRINKALGIHGINLRIDLRHIDKLRFSNLANTINRYKPKIDGIIEKIRALDNAKPDNVRG